MKAVKNTASPFVSNHIVIGDGWSAMAAVGFLIQAQKPVVWIAGTGARIFSALPSMEHGPGVELWQRLARGFGIETGAPLSGSFLREFRNKAFRQPAWTKAPTPEMRKQVLEESVWAPEQRLAPLWEVRFPLTLNEIDQQIRTLLLGDSEAGEPWRKLIRRIEGIPVHGFKVEEGRVTGVELGSGELISCQELIYADRWDWLPRLQGLAKNDLAFIRSREPASVLQAVFTHERPVGAALMEGFYGSLHRESGEEFERHVWGHFASDGAQSYWTLCLAGDEVEDNHQIGKKLRRLKSGLDKMFTGQTWLPEGKTEFMANVTGEAVRFHESVVFAEGEAPQKLVELHSAQGARFVTDGYGAASALIQVARALELSESEQPVQVMSYDFAEPGVESRTDSEAKGPDLSGPQAS